MHSWLLMTIEKVSFCLWDNSPSSILCLYGKSMPLCKSQSAVIHRKSVCVKNCMPCSTLLNKWVASPGNKQDWAGALDAFSDNSRGVCVVSLQSWTNLTLHPKPVNWHGAGFTLSLTSTWGDRDRTVQLENLTAVLHWPGSDEDSVSWLICRLFFTVYVHNAAALIICHACAWILLQYYRLCTHVYWCFWTAASRLFFIV